MATITSITGHTARALDFFNRTGYFGIGGTTAWNDENTPDTPTEYSILSETIGYKLIETKFLVYPVPEGEESTSDLEFNNLKWRIATPANALENNARWVYLSSNLSYSELPTDVVYRQVAVFTNMTPADGVPDGKLVLLPNEVANVGVQEAISFRKPTYREADKRETLSLLLEF